MNELNTVLNEKIKVILVGVLESTSKISNDDFLDDMVELKNLCESCDMEVVGQITQNLDSINKASYVGSGKIEEIRMMKDSLEADTIVCNDELSPAQIENLEDVLKDVRVIDRTYVILEIFDKRAKTKEAKLQVEIASLKYYLPRLKGLHSGMSRQGGGRNKGKGETKLELDRRKIEQRISLLNSQLKDLTKNRQQSREQRKKNNMMSVSLVGYTNSGKSTTLNQIMEKYSDNYTEEKQVFQKDMLFATLETSTRLIKLKNNLEFLLTDTVGFINKLPHTLVEAFKSTLEEIKESSLIVHVVDSSNPHYQDQINTTKKVLEEIGAKDIPVLYAFNKQDKLTDYFFIPNEYEDAVRYSAKTNKSLDELLEKIQFMLYKDYHSATFKIPYDKQNIVNMINNSSKVLQTRYEDYVYIEAFVSDYLYNYLKNYIVK